MINAGNTNNINQSFKDKDNVANKPTRAECAVCKIISIIGVANKNPIDDAAVLIFPTMICIWCAMNLSVAPTWFNISSSCLCNIAMFRDMYDMQTPIDTNINARINAVIETNFQPAFIDVFNAEL